VRVLRERNAELFLDGRHVAGDDLAPVVGADIGVEFMTEARLVVLEDFLEDLVVKPHDHVGIHLDEAAVAVEGEALVTGVAGDGKHRFIVEAEIEHRVHHARHRGAGAGADREQQRLFRIAECAPGYLADIDERVGYGGLEPVGHLSAIVIVPHTSIGGNRQARRNRQPEIAHFGKVGTLAAQKIAISRRSFGMSVAKSVDPFGHVLILHVARQQDFP
jgi:hypothetical protein